MDVGQQLKNYRRQKGLSMADIAKITGIPADRLYKWEKGSKPSDAEDLLKMKDLFSGKLENIPIALGNMESGKMKEGGNVHEKYLALLEDSLKQREADLASLRSAVEKMTRIDKVEQDLEALKSTVYGWREKAAYAEANLLGLQEWLIDEFSKLKKTSIQEIAASMGIRQVPHLKKAKQRGIQEHLGK